MELLDKDGLTEEQFLKNYNSDEYPKPSLTADIVLLAVGQEGPGVLLIKRGGHPCIDQWAFPGGFANMGESIEETAARELEEETGVKGLQLAPVGFFSKPGRDKRGWVVTQTFASVLPQRVAVKAQDDARDARWFDLSMNGNVITLTNGGTVISFAIINENGNIRIEYTSLDRLAFDHDEMLVKTLALVGNK